MHIGIVSDTHVFMKTDFSGLIKRLRQHFGDVDLIIHAGDICTLEFLEALEKVAPVEAVCGNSDDSSIRDKLDFVKFLNIDKFRIGICHNELSPSIIKQENINIVISGHTHIPEIREEPGVLFLNPGSTTFPKSPPLNVKFQKRRVPLPTVIILELDGDISSAFIYSFMVNEESS
ncbi:MAG: YfcE family phosphodiesterase [Candidatus Lokiarchaeota archaeon]|nr:YfcE family phosphodiesterase [Candidatus Lokiarchaeota archaeon]